LLQKLRAYADEFRLAISVTAPIDKVRLCGAICKFHLGNAFNKTGISRPKRYRVNLIGTPQDLWLRSLGGDIFVFYEIFGTNCYSPPQSLRDSLQTVIDLGANIGLTTLYLAARAPNARFICVEPVPANAELLRRNVAGISKAKVVNAAIAARSGTVMFDDSGAAWGGALSSQGRLSVRSISMNDLLAEYAPYGRIGLLKMDIEGAEQFILSGPMTWLERVDCIIAELHHPFSFEQFRDILSIRGFEVHNQSDAGFLMPTAVRKHQ
jgi:FkbM family methyltransferase